MSGEQQLVDDYIEQDQNSRLLKYGAAFAGTTALALAEMTFENNPAFAAITSATASCNRVTNNAAFDVRINNTTSQPIAVEISASGNGSKSWPDIEPHHSFGWGSNDVGSRSLDTTISYKETRADGTVVTDSKHLSINCQTAAPKPTTTRPAAPAPTTLRTVAPPASAPKATVAAPTKAPQLTAPSTARITSPRSEVITPTSPTSPEATQATVSTTESTTTSSTVPNTTTSTSTTETSTTAVSSESSSPTTEHGAIVIAQPEKPSQGGGAGGEILMGVGLTAAILAAGGLARWWFVAWKRRHHDEDGKQGHAGPAPAHP